LIDALEKIHGSGHIETVIVKDFSAEGAYDEAIKGVQGVVHAASDVSFGDDRETIVNSVLKGYTSILDAANSEKAIRRFVLTSSSIAIVGSNPTEKHQIADDKTWFDAAVEQSKTSPNGGNIYATSKVLSEKAAWDYQKKNKPAFSITAINPNANFGAPVPGTPFFSTGKWLMDFAEGKESPLNSLGPQYHVDVEDVAKLHVIALTREDVKNEVSTRSLRFLV
jgi:nucleoside-diphosphate-sugar epimerase